jgi:H-type lectin domain
MSEAGQQAQDTARAIVDNAQPLGLTWTLSAASVVEGSDPTAAIVLVDGASEPVPAVSLLGVLVNEGRVWVQAVPPSGLYVVGFGGDTHGVARGESGVETVSVVAAAGATLAVAFDHPFVNAPTVLTNIPSSAGGSTNFVSRATNISTTGFTIFIFRTDGLSVTVSVPVAWTATIFG